jgi:alpha-tubulin suppressor-like RCC1 family protein
MSNPVRSWLVLVATSMLVACTGRSDRSPLPTQPSVTQNRNVAPNRAALEARINTLINALYAPPDQGRVFAQFAQVKAQVASGQTSSAQAALVAFFGSTLADLKGGVLQDPNGAQSPTTAEALTELLDDVAVFGGMPAPIPSPSTLSGDGAVAVLGSSGGTVVTSGGFGGVRFPAGALPADVIVVVTRLPSPTVPKTGPLPTGLDQYPLFYDFSTFPTVAHFTQPVTVAICRLEVGDPFAPATETIADRLQLAHPDPANPATIERLDRVDADFVACDGVSLASAASTFSGGTFAARALASLAGAGARLARLFVPTPAYAVHGGLGGLTSSFSPFGAVDPGGVTPLFGQLAVGNFHACGIVASGQTWCWGDRVFGQLGNGFIAPAQPSPSAPVSVSGSPPYTEISSHGSHTCGMLPGGIAQCWGRNTDGEMGIGTSTVGRPTPVTVNGGPYLQISGGRLTTCALDLSHAAWCWGINQDGEVGNPAFAQPNGSRVPVLVSTDVTFRQIDASWVHTCALTTSIHPVSDVYCWGSARDLGAPTNITTPQPVAGAPKFERIFGGGTAECGITATLTAYCWGYNAAGALGDGTTTDRGVPTPVAGHYSFIMIATGTRPNSPLTHSCGITSDGTAYCWGSNDLGQLGDGTTTGKLVPTPVATSDKFVAIGAGDTFSCAMRADRKVLCWGDNALGQLGSGVAGGFSSTPVEVPSPF